MVQAPTCTGIRIRHTEDANRIFHAVALGHLQLYRRRLTVEERRSIHTGCIFVWEERNTSAEATGVSMSVCIDPQFLNTPKLGGYRALDGWKTLELFESKTCMLLVPKRLHLCWMSVSGLPILPRETSRGERWADCCIHVSTKRSTIWHSFSQCRCQASKSIS